MTFNLETVIIQLNVQKYVKHFNMFVFHIQTNGYPVYLKEIFHINMRH